MSTERRARRFRCLLLLSLRREEKGVSISRPILETLLTLKHRVPFRVLFIRVPCYFGGPKKGPWLSHPILCIKGIKTGRGWLQPDQKCKAMVRWCCMSDASNEVPKHWAAVRIGSMGLSLKPKHSFPKPQEPKYPPPGRYLNEPSLKIPHV